MERGLKFMQDNPRLTLFFLGSLFFIPFLGGVHLFDWDEINFASISQEMVITGEYLQVNLGGHPFWEKPPLFFWLQAISFNLFGINEFAARLPNAILGLATLQFIYWLGKKIENPTFAWWWALSYFGSLLPHIYFKSGIIDPVFNLLMFAALAFLFLASYQKARIRYGFLAGSAVALAVLAKGPVGILLVGLTWLIAQFLLDKSYRNHWSTIVAALFAGLATLGIWMAIEIYAHGTWFIEEFFRYQFRLLSTEDAGHGGFPGYHIVILLLGCFPASWLIFKAWRKKTRPFTAHTNALHVWMKILLVSVVLIFSIVQSKIVHYSSLAYFPITFFAAYAIVQLLREKKLPNYLKISWLLNGGILALAALLLPILGKNKDAWLPLIKDQMAQAQLGLEVDWPWYTFLPGLFFVGMLLLIYSKKLAGLHLKITALYLATAIFLTIGLWSFIGRIENYSQRALIEICKEKAGQGLILTHAGKSYAQYFYGMRLDGPPLRDGLVKSLDATESRDAYVISRIHKSETIRDRFGLEYVEERNGFVIYFRKGEKN